MKPVGLQRWEEASLMRKNDFLLSSLCSALNLYRLNEMLPSTHYT